MAMARQLLIEETPLSRDCGALCRAACCRTDRDGKGGMLLFPGEERFYEPLPEGFMISPDPDGLGLLLTCSGTCQRVSRPLACRFFPLFPYVRQTDRGIVLAIRMDRRAGSVCPLVEEDTSGLSGKFAAAVGESARILLKATAHRDFLVRMTRFMETHYTLNGGTACSGNA